MVELPRYCWFSAKENFCEKCEISLNFKITQALFMGIFFAKINFVKEAKTMQNFTQKIYDNFLKKAKLFSIFREMCVFIFRTGMRKILRKIRKFRNSMFPFHWKPYLDKISNFKLKLKDILSVLHVTLNLERVIPDLK